jgi:integrase
MQFGQDGQPPARQEAQNSFFDRGCHSIAACRPRRFVEALAEKRVHAHGLSAEFKEIMLKAEARGQIVQHNEKGRRNETKGFHSLRHSFNSALANKGVPLEVRKVLAGHASESYE